MQRTLILFALLIPSMGQTPFRDLPDPRPPFPPPIMPRPSPQQVNQQPRPITQLPAIIRPRQQFANIPKQNWKVVFVDSQDPSNPATNAIDNDAATLWATMWSASQPPFPHEIQINLGAVYPIAGFEFTPRQDGWPDGYLLNYEFYISSDGKTWGQPFLSGTFENNSVKKSLTAPSTLAGQYIRFRGLGDVNGGAVMVMAELDIIEGTLPTSVTIHVLSQTVDKSTAEPLASRTTALDPLSALCNLPVTPPPTEPSVINPTFAYFDDPFHAARLCRAPLPQDIPVNDTSRVVAVYRSGPAVQGDNEILSPRSNVAIPQPWFRSGLPAPPVPTSVRILP